MAAVHELYLAAPTPVHRLPAQVKVVATLLFVLAVVATPREALWAFGAYAALLAGVAAVARVGPATMLRRMAVETPFVLFALLLPVLAPPPDVLVGPLALSEAGLWQAWNILAKATLGVACSVLLASTTEVRDLLSGLQRLRVPDVFVAVASFMVRYLDVLLGEWHRMHVARVSRGYDPRVLWQAKALAAGVGSLFVRAYERGERVHLAMVSRGWNGRLPESDGGAATPRQWAGGLAVPGLAAGVAAVALVVT